MVCSTDIDLQYLYTLSVVITTECSHSLYSTIEQYMHSVSLNIFIIPTNGLAPGELPSTPSKPECLQIRAPRRHGLFTRLSPVMVAPRYTYTEYSSTVVRRPPPLDSTPPSLSTSLSASPTDQGPTILENGYAIRNFLRESLL